MRGTVNAPQEVRHPTKLLWAARRRRVAPYRPKCLRQECVSQAAQIMYARFAAVAARRFREVRRRLKVMGYFQNSKSCDRIIYAIFNYFDTKWTRNTEKIKAIKDVTDEAA